MESQDNSLHTELENDLQTEPPAGTLPPEIPGDAPPPSAKKSKTPLIIGIAIAAVLLFCVCLAGVILWKTGVLPIFAPRQAAPELMPADTAFFALVNIDIEDTAGYKHLAKVYGDVPQVEDALDDFLNQVEDELDMSYEDDIKPWLGPELAMGMVNMADALEGEDPVFVIAAGTRDTKASDAFLEKMLDKLKDEGYGVDEETYQNVDYYVAEPADEWETPLILGTVKKSVILTMDENTMQDVIDVTEGKSDSLADNERYVELVAALPDDAVAHMFLNLEDVVEASLRNLERELEGGPELPRETTGQLEAFQAMGVALNLDTEGLVFDFAMTFDPDTLSPKVLENMDTRASANRILERIPNDALGFLSGQNLAAAWKSALTSLMQVPDVEQQLDDLGAALGLKLDEELLDWLPGEFAFAVVEARGAAAEEVPVGVFAVFEIDDREEAEEKLGDIVNALAMIAGFEFVEEDVSGVKMQVLMDPYSGDIILGYGFTDKHLVIGFTEGALEVAANDDIASIDDHDTFKKVQEHLSRKTGGYLYVDIEAALQLAYQNMSDWEREEFDESTRPFLEPIRAMGLAAPPTDPKEGVGHSTLFLYIPEE